MEGALSNYDILIFDGLTFFTRILPENYINLQEIDNIILRGFDFTQTIGVDKPKCSISNWVNNQLFEFVEYQQSFLNHEGL